MFKAYFTEMRLQLCNMAIESIKHMLGYLTGEMSEVIYQNMSKCKQN